MREREKDRDQRREMKCVDFEDQIVRNAAVKGANGRWVCKNLEWKWTQGLGKTKRRRGQGKALADRRLRGQDYSLVE